MTDSRIPSQAPRGRPAGTRNARRPSMNLKEIAFEQAERSGVDLKTVVWAVLASMIQRARNGDVRAAELVIEALCDNPQEVHVTHEGFIQAGPPEPDTRTLAQYLSDLAHLPPDVRQTLINGAEAEDIAAELRDDG